MITEHELDADILLVEDDPNDAELVRRALKRAGALASIVHVQDGAEALDYLYGRGAYAARSGHAQPKLMLLDLKLPKLTGLEVLREVRAHPELQRQVANLAQDSGLVISRMQSSTLSATGQSVVLQLQLESRGKIDALQKFLYAVESGKPYVFANEADISIAPAEDTDLPDGAPLMSLRLVLQATGWIGGT